MNCVDGLPSTNSLNERVQHAPQYRFQPDEHRFDVAVEGELVRCSMAEVHHGSFSRTMA